MASQRAAKGFMPSIWRAISHKPSQLYQLRSQRFLSGCSRLHAESNQNASTPKSEVPATAAQALQALDASENSLQTPVYIPEDPNAVLKERHPAASLLSHSALVVERQLEMMNLMIGFEQANRYVMLDPQGNHIGYMAEQELGMGNSFARQMFRTHRRFTAHVFDRGMKELLRFHRPFSWISSRIGVYDPVKSAEALSQSPISTPSTYLVDQPSQISTLSLAEMRRIGEAHQQWAPLRRKYNLFLARDLKNENSKQSSEKPSSNRASEQALIARPEASYEQFAYVDEPFLSWDFSLRSADSGLIGSVSRNWRGFGREIFTDTGAYVLRMDSTGLQGERKALSPTASPPSTVYDREGGGMTLDQRAVMLATAVTVDFDYFSRSRGGMMPFPLWFGGAGSEAAGAEAGAAGAVGAQSGAEVASTAPSAIVPGTGTASGSVAEGAATGAGAAAAYEAMQGGRKRSADHTPAADDQSPLTNPGEGQQSYPPGRSEGQDQEEVWGEDEQWPGNQQPGSGGSGNSSGSADGDGGGGGGGWGIEDFFSD